MGLNPLKKNQRLEKVRRIAPLVAAGAAAMIPATIGASMVIDLLQKRDREQREAPRPGTFHASVEGSELSIFTDGETLYEDMLDVIGSATESIDQSEKAKVSTNA